MIPFIKEELKQPNTHFSNLISKPPQRAATCSTPIRNPLHSPNSHDKYKHVIMFKKGIFYSKTEERRSKSMQGFLTDSGKERTKFINFGNSGKPQDGITTNVKKYYQLCAKKIDSIYSNKNREEQQSRLSNLSETHFVSNQAHSKMKGIGIKENKSNHEELRRIKSLDITSWLNKIEVVQILDNDYKIPLQRLTSKDYDNRQRVNLFKICNKDPIKRKRSMFNKRNNGCHEEFVLDAWESVKNTIENPF